MSTYLIMAREGLPQGHASVFIGGPNVERGDQEPWRHRAVDLIRARWAEVGGGQPLAVLSPESREGRRADRYEDQVDWEIAAREQATVRLYWMWRDMDTMPGMTSNVEIGYDLGRGRAVVLGLPPDCPNPERNRYIRHLAGVHRAPVRPTLETTVDAALDLLLEPTRP
jgi:hypothetical protein